MYSNGWGVEHDDEKAAELYRKSAEQGYASAQLNLGVMYAKGQSVKHNVIEAYKWFDIAAWQGEPQAAKNRDALARLMPPASVDQAKHLADAWIDAHQPSKQ